MIATCANPTCNAPFRYFRSGKEQVSSYGRDRDENRCRLSRSGEITKKPYEAGMKVFMLETDNVDPRSRTDFPKRRIEYNLPGAGCVESSVFGQCRHSPLRSPVRVFYDLTIARRWTGTCNA